MDESSSRLVAQGVVGQVYGNPDQQRNACLAEPGFHNVLGMESGWRRQPEQMDFLLPDSPFFLLKQLSTQIYWQFVTPKLQGISKTCSVLDAGCGIGRFTIKLARRFDRVVALDPCRSSLQACARHLEKRDLRNVQLHWADLSWLDTLPPDCFDLLFAAELIGYTADPVASLKRLVRVAKPGAIFFVTVEGRPGAAALQGLDDPTLLLDALDGNPIIVDQDRYVRLFTQEQFDKTLRNAGIKDPIIEGSHYFGEGPFWQAIDDDRLGDPAYVRSILDAEASCAKHPMVAPWARVFSAVGKG